MQWRNLHQTHFSTSGKTWDQAYDTWETLFLFDGFKPVDVLEAVEELTKSAVGKPTPDGHYEYLKTYLFRSRDRLRKALEAKRLEEKARHECKSCNGVGIVIGVPHPDHCKHGQWEPREQFGDYVTASVYCNCGHGARRHSDVVRWWTESRRDDAPMNLDQYERLVPDWREQIQAHKERRKLEQTLKPPAATGGGSVRGGKKTVAAGLNIGNPYGWEAIEAPEWEPQPGEGPRQ